MSLTTTSKYCTHFKEKINISVSFFFKNNLVYKSLYLQLNYVEYLKLI